MKEQEYINTKALGTVMAAIHVLNDLDHDNLKGIIKEGEAKQAIGTLYDWQDRLFKQIQVKED